MTQIKVLFSQIKPRNFQCGDVVGGNDKAQYHIVDAVNGTATLEKIEKADNVKSKFLDGTVFFFDGDEFRTPGNAEPCNLTIAEQIQNEIDPEQDPEDFYENNYVPGLT